MTVQPIIISTWSFGLRGHAAAWPSLGSGGSSLDAVESACTAVEADPEVDSVGYGGLPDRDGRVSLDACIMTSPAHCGSVCAVTRHLHVTSMARAVMERTPHVMIAGPGADDFADAQGFARRELLSPEARAKWEAWKAQPRGADSPDQSSDKGYAPPAVGPAPFDTGGAHGGRLFHESRTGGHDTIGVLALDSRGQLAGACSTSGMPYKLPGRVGDSPIIGSGLYVDPQHGAATATGSGELIMGVSGAFLAVELMRRGARPLDALRETLQRIRDSYDLAARGGRDQVAMIALAPDGAWAGAALRSGFKMSVTTGERNEVVEPGWVMMG